MQTMSVGGTIDLAVGDKVTLAWSWENEFSAGVALVDEGTFVVVDDTDPTNTTEIPTIDSESLGGDNITVSFRVLCDTALLGHIFRATHTVATTESPDQARSRSFYIQTRVL